MYEAADANKIAGMMTIDESAAFDCMEPIILDEKLKIYNISQETRVWIRDGLT